MFVLLGLVILMVVGVLYIVSTAQRERENLQDRIEGTIALSDMALIDRHVGSCLDTIVTDELRIIGDTGALGVNGPSAIVGADAASRRVGYGVTRNGAASDTDVLPIAKSGSAYPDVGVGIENSTTDPSTGNPFPGHSGGYFGDVQFVAICDRDGPNPPTASVSCSSPSGSYPGSPPGTVGPSVQETVERNIEQRVAACASSRVFTDAIGRDVTQVGDAMVNVTYLPSGLAVSLQYPLELDGDVVLQTAPIARSYDVRLLSILQFATDLARAESRNVTFTPETDYRSLSSWKEGFDVRRSRNVQISSPISGGSVGSITEHADMIAIIDTHSELSGVAYTFRFLVEHRVPMLQSMSDVDALRFFRDGETPSYPVAADPDDGIIPIGDQIAVEFPSSGPYMQIVVWDSDCPIHSDTACLDYDYLNVYTT